MHAPAVLRSERLMRTRADPSLFDSMSMVLYWSLLREPRAVSPEESVSPQVQRRTSSATDD